MKKTVLALTATALLVTGFAASAMADSRYYRDECRRSISTIAVKQMAIWFRNAATMMTVTAMIALRSP